MLLLNKKAGFATALSRKKFSCTHIIQDKRAATQEYVTWLFYEKFSEVKETNSTSIRHGEYKIGVQFYKDLDKQDLEAVFS